MPKQIPLIDSPSTLNTLPTAKVKKADKVGVHSWVNFYAAFSEAFVNHSLETFDITPDQIILDPFVGSGTTMVAAIKKGVPAIGVDLDPFSCLLSRSKIAINADPVIVHNILNLPPSNKLLDFAGDASKLFDKESLSYASSIFLNILSQTSSTRLNVLDILLSDKKGKYDSEVVALTALIIASPCAANVVRGSNPTWYRKTVQGEKHTTEKLNLVTIEVANKMLADLKNLRHETKKRNIKIICSNINNISKIVDDNSIDFVITSPPYLTRLDYVIKHLPNLQLLTGLIDVDIDALRKEMIGTPKVINKDKFQNKFGKTCQEVLDKIDNHESYASKSYYFWIYFQYFSSLQKSLSVISNICKKNCNGLIVIENSFYKDIDIDLGFITKEMLSTLGLKAEVIKAEPIKARLKYVNPKHKRNTKEQSVSENVVFFSR